MGPTLGLSPRMVRLEPRRMRLLPRIHLLPLAPLRSAAEWQLEGEGPWALGEDVELIATPGHTAGCVSLLYRPDRALFTGDHLAYSARLGRLTIFRCVRCVGLGVAGARWGWRVDARALHCSALRQKPS